MPDAAVKSGGHYTLRIVYDEYAPDPRVDRDNFGKMACWHSGYNLGGRHDHSNPDAFLTTLVSDTIPDRDVIAYVKDGKADDLKLEYNKSSREWDLSSYDDHFKKWYRIGNYPAPLDMENAYLADNIRENMAMPELMSLAERANLILPLYLLDHSGITISTRDFNDRWDSGQIGWTYVSNEDIAKEFGKISPGGMEKAERPLFPEVET